jgi:Undecaprenyl-phosphate glucose phosphotransferase
MLSHSASKTIDSALESQFAARRDAVRSVQKAISEPVLIGLVGAWDGLCIFLAGLTSMIWLSVHVEVDLRLSGLVLIMGTIVALNLMHLAGAYKMEILRQVEIALGEILFGWILTVGTLIAILHITESVTTSLTAWLLSWSVVALLLLIATRFGLHFALGRWTRAGRLCRNIAVIGAGPLGQRFLRHLSTSPDSRVRIVGVYDDRRERRPSRCMGHPVVGGVDDLLRDIRQQTVDSVIVALPLSADWRLAEVLNKLMLVPVDVRLCPDQFGFQLGACKVSQIGGLTVLNAADKPLQDWRWIAKIIEDRVLACLILFLISPVLLLIALAVKLDSKGPVFFKQRRYGFNNELIEVLKFRSMYSHSTDANAEQLARRNDPRITKVGAFLRKTSLDELPQFINVLRGEMSIVGPRPHALAAKAGRLLYQDAVKYYDSRHRMKPGITGWAQVNGWRGETETVEQIAKRVEHDLYYIENWSVILDLKIIVRTILGGFTGRHAY